MQYLLSLVFPILSFIFQSYPRFFNKYFGVDVWTRLIEIEHVKKARHRIPGKIKNGFIIDGEFDYPIIFPWIFSFFPKKTILKYQGFVSPFFDALQNLLIFYICYFLTNDIFVSLTAQAMYSVIPIIPIENSYLTPRSMGYFNFTLAFLPIFLFHVNHNPIFLLISLFFTCTLFLTHRFALQSLVIISIFFTLVDFSPLYVINILISFVIVVVLTKGFYLRVLRGHFFNVYFWVKNYKYRFAHQIYGLKRRKKIDWVGKIYSLLSIFSPIFLFAINIWSFSSIIYFLDYLKIIQIPHLISSEIFLKFALWILFFYIFGAIVLRIKRLIPIGEGQRYLEMTSVPSVILSAMLFFSFFRQNPIISTITLSTLLLANFFLILLVQIKGIITDKNRSLTTDLQNAYSFLNKMKQKPRVLCVPHQITTMTVYNTHADVLVNADNPGLMKIQEIYPVLRKSIRELAKEYNLDYLLLRESYVGLSELNVNKSKVIYRSGDILVADIKRLTS